MLASLGIERGERVSAPARRVLLHRRRAALDRPAARRRRDLRQQPLHAVRHADAPRLRRRRHGRGARRARRARARVRHRGGAAPTSSSPRAACRSAKPISSSSCSSKLGEVLFWKIAMKPGRPLAYGRIGGAHFFGLPGNPVSVMVTFYQFVRDALLVLQGRRDVTAVPTFAATLSAPIRKAPGRTEFQRGILTPDAAGGYTVRTTGDQGSGILSSMSRANCFIVLPADCGNVDAGADGRRAAARRIDLALRAGLLSGPGPSQTPCRIDERSSKLCAHRADAWSAKEASRCRLPSIANRWPHLSGRFPAPELIDVRTAAAVAAHPVVIPGALMREPATLLDWALRLDPWRAVVVVLQGGSRAQLRCRVVAVRTGPARPRARRRARSMARRTAALPRSLRPPTRWVTRERPKIDRIACPWLVRRFIDPAAEFHFVPAPHVRAFAAEHARDALRHAGRRLHARRRRMQLRRLHRAACDCTTRARSARGHRARRGHRDARRRGGGAGPARHVARACRACSTTTTRCCAPGC